MENTYIKATENPTFDNPSLYSNILDTGRGDIGQPQPPPAPSAPSALPTTPADNTNLPTPGKGVWDMLYPNKDLPNAEKTPEKKSSTNKSGFDWQTTLPIALIALWYFLKGKK